MIDPKARTHGIRALIELRKQILAGELPAGTRLLEVPTAEALSISRTPVREALSRLVEEGLLERLRGGGFQVRRFGVQDVIDAIELRGVMEGTAARLAAERGVPAQRLDQLDGIVAELDTCFGPGPEDIEFERYSELNAAFHTALHGLCGSAMIRREAERATHLPFASPSAFLPDTAGIDAFRKSLRVAQDQHRNIAAAIRGREGARAEALAREHARLARGNLEYLLSGDPEMMGRVPGLALVTQ